MDEKHAGKKFTMVTPLHLESLLVANEIQTVEVVEAKPCEHSPFFSLFFFQGPAPWCGTPQEVCPLEETDSLNRQRF